MTTRISSLRCHSLGYTVRASKDEPQYEIKSDTTGSHRHAQGIGAEKALALIR